MVKVPNPVDSNIEEYTKANDAAVWGPLIEHETLPLPVAFCESEPLHYLGMGGSLDDISICLADYGEGDGSHKTLNSLKLTLTNSDSHREAESEYQFPNRRSPST